MPPVLGTVRVAATRAADDNQLFEARPRARLWTTNGPAPVEWGLSIGSATAIEVPVGSYTLSAFAVYMSDTLVCTDNTNGAPGQTCLQPTIGTGLTCDLPVVVAEATPVEATFQILANGHCRIDPVPGTEPPSPAASLTSPGSPAASG